MERTTENDSEGWLPGKWDYVRENPGWNAKYPFGPVHFDFRAFGYILREVPAPNSTPIYRNFLERAMKLHSKEQIEKAKLIYSLKNVDGDGI